MIAQISQFQALAFAKVNLHLGVGPVRSDGFHELATVFQSLNLSDTVTLTLLEETTADPSAVVQGLEVSGPHAAGVPEDSTNLAWQAVQAVVDRLMPDYDNVPRCRIHIDKKIPAAGGMAGGSADCAAALVLADKAYGAQQGLGQDILVELAADLGSDVPFTLRGGTALGTGRGEKLAPMMSRGTYHWALITNERGLSTPQVFHKLDELRAAGRDIPPLMDTAAVSQALISGDPSQLAAHLANNLQPAALSLRPDLRKIVETGKRAGALNGIVSGSGPTCAFLCEDPETAMEVVAQVTADNRGTRGVVTTGPAGGVTVISP